jgi:serine/threonine protein kinase/Tol biopolymer transport system component
MDPEVLALFHELADRSPSERDDYYAQRQVPPAVRKEVESLLRFDRSTAPSLGQYVAAAAERVLQEDDRTPRKADLVGRMIRQYRIVGKIGEGGMGVVYRAEDLMLHRSVAVKVISDRFDESAEAQARFLREARSVAALNHPNICTIHEVLEIDDERGQAVAAPGSLRRPLIVLELVEGETVQARLSRTERLEVPDLLSIATQVADALAEAHRRRIIHRDLKPGNIMVTPAGRVKILDFGLAKPLIPLSATGDETTTAVHAVGLPEQMSTLAGTIAYMSPEQAEGLPLDSRSDIFSFGTVLYEMSCGRRPFQADTRAGTIARILNANPPSILQLRHDLPPGLDEIVRRCLEKKPDQRYDDSQHLVKDLNTVRANASAPAGPALAPAPLRWRPGLLLLLAAGVVIAVPLTRALLPRTGADRPASTHRQVTFVGDASYPAISADGTLVAYVRGEPWGEPSEMVAPIKRQKLVVEEAATGRALEIAECAGCRDPKWAPDGSGVIVVDGAAGVLLFSRMGGERRRYGALGIHLAWSPDGREFAAAKMSSRVIAIVDKDTGKRTDLPLNAPSVWLRALDWSSGGRWIAAATHGEQARFSVWVLSRDGKTQQEILSGDLDISGIRWSHGGDVIYFLRRRGQVRELWKIAVSPETGRAAGPAALVVGGLQAGPNFALSKDGKKLLYTREVRYSNLWIAPLGRTLQTGTVAPRQISFGTLTDNFPAVSPDGAQIAFMRNDGRASNVFVVPFSGGTARQLTFLDSADGAPAWSPDGRALAFCAAQDGVNKVWTVQVAGGAPLAYPATRCTSGTAETPIAWVLRDTVLYQRDGNRNYHVLDLASAAEAPLIRNDRVGWLFAPHLSPDATQLAVYWNRQMGRGLFVIPWPARETMARYLVHAAWPMAWSADGQSIYAYDMTAAEVLKVRLDGTTTLLGNLSDRRIALVPAITPDKKHVVFSAHAIYSDVWVMEDFDPDRP